MRGGIRVLMRGLIEQGLLASHAIQMSKMICGLWTLVQLPELFDVLVMRL